MEYLKKMRENQQNLERLVMILYSLYTLHLTISGILLHWEGWIVGVIIGCYMLALGFVLGHYKTHRFRMTVNTLVIQISFMMYVMKAHDLEMMLFNYTIIILVIALYGIPKMLWMTTSTLFLIGFYHLIVAGDRSLHNVAEKKHFALELVLLLVSQLFITFWTIKREETAEKMVQIIENLMEAEQSKDDFLANVSHEIRTPINTIYGMSDMALTEQDAGKLREDLYDIRTSGQNLMALVNDILDFSELQSGKMELEEEVYNFSSTLHDVINLIMAEKNEESLDLIVDCDAGIPSSLMGDEKKLRRIIMNLVDNAIKFTREGCITLRIEYRREQYGINLSVSIKDTGIGIDEENKKLIFQRFSQIDSKRNRQEGGIGLGLAISKALVQRMGGTLIAKSKLHHGTTMKIVVPQKIVEDVPIASVKEALKCRVGVYVDMERLDSVSMRDDYRSLLGHMSKQLGVRCHSFRNLAELKRRERKATYTHIFIGVSEYLEDKEYFEELSGRQNVILMLDNKDNVLVQDTKLQRLYKPVYVLPVVSILNGSHATEREIKSTHRRGFIAPEAKLLIVDDNMMNLRVAEKLLSRYQLKTETAVSGQQALEKIQSKDFDFIFMDHMMPEMDGIETLHRIRRMNDPYFQKVPVVALTANALPGNREMFLQEGFTDFLSKPIEVSVLERVLKRNLPEEKQIVKIEEKPDDRTIQKNMQESLDEKGSLAGESKPSADSQVVIADLDVSKGTLYCGGMNFYLEILQNTCEDAVANYQLLNRLYQEQDWKNYTIKIHALKSSMMNIGATALAEQAKALEMAGKHDEPERILEGHDAVMQEYRSLMERLRESEVVYPKGCSFEYSWEASGTSEAEAPSLSEEELETLEELSEEQFDRIQERFEQAMYELDPETMLGCLDELNQYRYGDIVMKNKLTGVRGKVEKEDLISAGDALSKIRGELKG